MSLLVRTPAPFVSESLLGFVLRVSENNGYDTPWHILRLAEIEQGQMQTAGFPIEKLSKVLGHPPESLAHIAYHSDIDKGHFKILDHSLGQRLTDAPLRLAQPAFCQHCVEETGHIDAFWDLNAAIACPKHRCPPLRHCPSCKKAIRWFRPGLLTCSCGANLAHAKSIPIDGPVIELMEVILSKLHGKPLIGLQNESGFPLAQMSPIPLWTLLQILEKLGNHQLCNQGKSDEKSASKIAYAVAPLRNWPTGYHQFLAELGQRLVGDTPSAAGFRAQFKPFYEGMFKNRTFADSAGFLREEFISFGLRHWGNAVVDNKLLRTPHLLSEQRFISKTEYARRHGIWKPSMDRMIDDGIIVTKRISTGKGSRVVVDLENTKVPVESKGIVPIREAAEHLGLPVSVLQYLRDAGIFHTKPRLGYEQSWHKDDVEEFLAQGLAFAAISLPTQNTVLLGEVMRLKLRNHAAKGDIVAAALDGRLSVHGRIEGNLAGLLLNKAELEAFVLNKRREIEGNTNSLAEAATLTGLDIMAIADAIEKGFLSAVDCDGRRRVSASSVALFIQKYVPLSKIANSLGSLTQHLWRMCNQLQIPVVVFSRSNNSGNQPIIARESEEFLIKTWKAEREAKAQKSLKSRQNTHEESLLQYLDSLQNEGKPLPRRAGLPNKVAIAKACGFNRELLYSSEALIALVDEHSRNELNLLNRKSLDPLSLLKDYLENLEKTGTPLPRAKNLQASKQAIANACGFHRNVLYNHAEAIAVLDKYASAEKLAIVS